MRIPESLASLADLGIIEEVVRPLMSGKEAQVYLVVAGGEQRVAKIYKDAQHRTFKHRAEYTEGRKTRNTRDQRAIGKRTAHGRAQDEAAWRSTEVDTLYRLYQAGVRVPVPYNFIDGVLVMELVTDAAGQPAPRLAEVPLDGVEATAIYEHLLREVVRMLCAGVVHGDLSEFNVLMAADGPVIIDFPQSVDPAHNTNARKLLVRDVDNLHDFLGRLVRPAQRRPFAEEMWELYEANGLTPETPLTGRYRASSRAVDTASVLALIDEANRDERRRREHLGIKGGPAEAAAPGRFEGQRGAGHGRGMPSRTTKAAAPAGASRNDQQGRTNAGANARPDAQRPRHGQQRAQSRMQQRHDERSARSHMPQQPRSPLHADRPPSRMNERPSHGSRPPLPNERPPHRHTAPSRPTGAADTRPTQGSDGAPAGRRARRRHRKGPPPTRGF